MGAGKTPRGNIAFKRKSAKNAEDKKLRRRKKKETFSSYIYKVLKQIHQDTGISKNSMSVMNSFIYDLFEKIASEASKLVRIKNKHTLSAREIDSSIKLLLPGELAKHAIIEGKKALNNITEKS